MEYFIKIVSKSNRILDKIRNDFDFDSLVCNICWSRYFSRGMKSRGIPKEDRQWRGSRNQGRLFCTIARARCALPLLDLHVRHVAIRASTFAIVIVAGRASNKLWTWFAELSRHITRRMTTIPMEEKNSLDFRLGRFSFNGETRYPKWIISLQMENMIRCIAHN